MTFWCIYIAKRWFAFVCTVNVGYSDWQNILRSCWAGSFCTISLHLMQKVHAYRKRVHSYIRMAQPTTNPIINLSILQASHQLMENTNPLSYYNSFHLLRKSKTVNWPLLGTETSSADHWLHTVTIHSQGKHWNWKVLLRPTKLYKIWTEQSPPLPSFLVNPSLLLCSH